MCLYVILLDAKEVLFTLILNVIYWGKNVILYD